MIDIHSHILYDVDDGSKSLADSLEILKKAEKVGFTDVILTPHYIEGYYENKKSIIKNKIQDLKKEVYENDIIVELHQGNEILLTQKTPELLEKGTISTLGNSRYVLFELPFSNKMLDLEQIIFKIKSLGFIPVLAHPERYAYIQENPNELIKIIQRGVFVQCNYGSFVGQYGKSAKRTVELLLENRLIHFMGTDTHRQGYVYDNMNQIIKSMSDIVNDDKYIDDITCNNAKKILNDLEIYVECPDSIKRKKKVFFFF